MINKPLFFLHIPRTGGTTIDSILFNNIECDKILKIYKKEEYEKYKDISKKLLVNIKYITGHLLLSSYNPLKIYDIDVSVFTFLRDPIKRLISEYYFYKTWKNNHLYSVLNKNNISFSQYLMSQDPLFKYRGKNFMTRCISGVSFQLDSFPRAALSSAKRQLDKNFLFFGLLEYFDESVCLMKNILNLNNILYQQRNKLSCSIIRSISDNDIDIAMELNKADFELYLFAKDLFREKIDKLGTVFRSECERFKFINNKFQSMTNKIDMYLNTYTDNSIILPK